MAMHTTSKLNKSVMGFSYYYYYFKACFFAGLFRRVEISPLPVE